MAEPSHESAPVETRDALAALANSLVRVGGVPTPSAANHGLGSRLNVSIYGLFRVDQSGVGKPGVAKKCQRNANKCGAGFPQLDDIRRVNVNSTISLVKKNLAHGKSATHVSFMLSPAFEPLGRNP